MTFKIFVAVLALGPSALLVGCALWAIYTQPEPLDDFLENSEAKAAVQQNYDDRIRSALIPAKPAVEVVEALKVAREEIVIAIAFLGRDAGTSRIDRTIESLINRLVKADQLAQAALSQNEGDRK